MHYIRQFTIIDTSTRSSAARGWSQCVRFGNFEDYTRRLKETRVFFELRFEEAGKLGSEMIKSVMETEVTRRQEDAWGIE